MNEVFDAIQTGKVAEPDRSLISLADEIKHLVPPQGNFLEPTPEQSKAVVKFVIVARSVQRHRLDEVVKSVADAIKEACLGIEYYMGPVRDLRQAVEYANQKPSSALDDIVLNIRPFARQFRSLSLNKVRSGPVTVTVMALRSAYTNWEDLLQKTM